MHPRTSDRGYEAWAELTSVRVEARFTVAEVAITAYDGARWSTPQIIPLAGRRLSPT